MLMLINYYTYAIASIDSSQRLVVNTTKRSMAVDVSISAHIWFSVITNNKMIFDHWKEYNTFTSKTQYNNRSIMKVSEWLNFGKCVRAFDIK